jgi:hypothetical protein
MPNDIESTNNSRISTGADSDALVVHPANAIVSRSSSNNSAYYVESFILQQNGNSVVITQRELYNSFQYVKVRFIMIARA